MNNGEMGDEVMDWIKLARDRTQWWTFSKHDSLPSDVFRKGVY
jgi:hypothetical protein